MGLESTSQLHTLGIYCTTRKKLNEYYQKQSKNSHSKIATIQHKPIALNNTGSKALYAENCFSVRTTHTKATPNFNYHPDRFG